MAMEIFKQISLENSMGISHEEIRALLLATIVRKSGGMVVITPEELADTIMTLGDIAIAHPEDGDWTISVTSIREEATENAQN